MSLDEILEQLNSGELSFCPPPADAYFAPQFVEDFVSRVFRKEWRYCGATGESRLTDFVEPHESEEVSDRIREIYGIDCSDIPEHNFWLCLKRCEAAAEKRDAISGQERMSD
jgi:hypothetical protein